MLSEHLHAPSQQKPHLALTCAPTSWQDNATIPEDPLDKVLALSPRKNLPSTRIEGPNRNIAAQHHEPESLSYIMFRC